MESLSSNSFLFCIRLLPIHTFPFGGLLLTIVFSRQFQQVSYRCCRGVYFQFSAKPSSFQRTSSYFNCPALQSTFRILKMTFVWSIASSTRLSYARPKTQDRDILFQENVCKLNIVIRIHQRSNLELWFECHF